jgi:phage tail-like protein
MPQDQIVSASQFYFSTSQITPVPISELKNINSQVEASEYIYNDEKGKTLHTKQYGKTKPPSVTFVTGLEPVASTQFFLWHDMARGGVPTARDDAEVYLLDAGGTFKLTYLLEAAWVAKLDISGAKAGGTENITLTVTLECDKITCTATKQ